MDQSSVQQNPRAGELAFAVIDAHVNGTLFHDRPPIVCGTVATGNNPRYCDKAGRSFHKVFRRPSLWLGLSGLGVCLAKQYLCGQRWLLVLSESLSFPLLVRLRLPALIWMASLNDLSPNPNAANFLTSPRPGLRIKSPDIVTTQAMTDAPLAQLDRASDYGSEGWRFDSSRAYHFSLRN